MVAGVHYTVLAAAKPKTTTGWTEPNQSTRRNIQAQLKRLGRYSGALDSIWGTGTIMGLQRSIRAMDGIWSGVDIDGVVGMDTLNGMSTYSRRSGTGMGPGGNEQAWWGGVLTRLSGV